jgi:S-adenosylmethionine-diacylglycerol 3-amino-3-carboxypropyl transferase
MATVAPSRLQFAVVREDPRIEQRALGAIGARSALLIASGGCTALYLRAALPELALELIDPNPAQLAHVDQKRQALTDFVPAAFNVGDADPGGPSECGNFERLFRLFRSALDLFVVSADERARRCADPHADWSDVIAHRHWPAAFASAFADELLVAMFGPDAVQHATPGSYPGYFRRRIEHGLTADDRCTNPWLHHVLLGCYRDEPAAWPPYLQQRPRDLSPFRTHDGSLLDVASFAPFDFVQLSNVMDWMAPDACRALADRLVRELRPGAGVLWRQLNNERDLTGHFAPAFVFDAARDAALTRDERSLFYNRVHFGIHR